MSPELAALARVAGVETSYVGWQGAAVAARSDALLAALRALGHDVRTAADAGPALVAAEHAHWNEVVPPVVVAWDGAVVEVPARVAADVDDDWHLELVTESGRSAHAAGRLFTAPAEGHAWPRARGGRVHCVRRIVIAIPDRELGYHTLRWSIGEVHGESLVLAAPTVAYGAPALAPAGAAAGGPRRWGVFAPLYAMRTAGSGETGDLDGLRRLLAAVRGRGGSYVATLPLLAAFLDEPCQVSPYSPASRLYWNELYAGVPSVDAGDADADAGAPTPGPLVDYRAQYAWRRQLLDAAAVRAWQTPATRAELEAVAHGTLLDYAVFRAIGEVERTSWPSWPARWRDLAPVPSLAEVPADVDATRVRFHLWAQWHTGNQLAELKRDFDGLYLDLPVGVNRDAYEVWRDRDRFLLDLSAGAPPDALFLGGQEWGLPPVHPVTERAAGYRYLRACFAAHMQYASMLRIDHAMGLHRLYCVPRGFAATEGVYLRYQPDELYAIAILESHRHRCALVGEDLGTVPPEVRPAMRRHGVASLYVGQFAMPAAVGKVMGKPTAAQVASLNTHDTATFAGWWQGGDIDDRRGLGLITAVQEAAERVARAAARAAVLAMAGAKPVDDPSAAGCARALAACTRVMADSPAHLVLVTLEDLWLEPATQNVPGTTDQRANWRRPWSKSLDAVLDDPAVTAALADLAHHRA